MTEFEPSGLRDLSRGDPDVARRLRESLDTLADRSDDQEFVALVDDVLAGRVSLREAARHGLFDEGISAVVRRGVLFDDDDGVDGGEDWNVRTFR